jgi:hypothetical protein
VHADPGVMLEEGETYVDGIRIPKSLQGPTAVAFVLSQKKGGGGGSAPSVCGIFCVWVCMSAWVHVCRGVRVCMGACVQGCACVRVYMGVHGCMCGATVRPPFPLLPSHGPTTYTSTPSTLADVWRFQVP